MTAPHADVTAVVVALAGVGLIVDDLTVLPREAGRQVLVSARSGVAVRLEDDESEPAQVARWMRRAARLVDEGALLLPALRRAPVVLPDGRTATVWPRADACLNASPGIAVILRSLHDCTPDDLPEWDLLEELRGRREALRHGEPGSTGARLAQWIDDLDRHRPPLGVFVPAHCDAHSGNVMRLAGQDVLIDLDGIARGPREYDLATWLVDDALAAAVATSPQDLIRAYGPDLVDADVLAWCMDLREANLVSWSVTDGRHVPDAPAKLRAAMASIRPTSGWWRFAQVA